MRAKFCRRFLKMLSWEIVFAELLLISLSLSHGSQAGNTTVHGVLDSSVDLVIPDYMFKDGDRGEWKRGNERISKWSSDGVSNWKPGFKAFMNGTLRVLKLTEHKQRYTVEVNNKDGNQVKMVAITLVGLEAVPKPTVTFVCQTSLPESTIICQVEHGSKLEFVVQINGKNMTDQTASNSTSVTYSGLEKGRLKCEAKNPVSRESVEVDMSCHDQGLEFDIWLWAAIAGAGVIVLIFVALLIHCILRCKQTRIVKQTCDEDVELSTARPPPERNQRRVPDPRNQPMYQPRQQTQHPQQQQQHPLQEQQQQQQQQHPLQQHQLQQQLLHQHQHLKKKGHPHKVPQQKKMAHDQLPSQQKPLKQKPQLPLHHPSSFTEETPPRAQPRAQQKPPRRSVKQQLYSDPL